MEDLLKVRLLTRSRRAQSHNPCVCVRLAVQAFVCPEWPCAEPLLYSVAHLLEQRLPTQVGHIVCAWAGVCVSVNVCVCVWSRNRRRPAALPPSASTCTASSARRTLPPRICECVCRVHAFVLCVCVPASLQELRVVDDASPLVFAPPKGDFNLDGSPADEGEVVMCFCLKVCVCTCVPVCACAPVRLGDPV